MEDNLTTQIEEIEALAAIYGEELVVLEEANRKYCIRIKSEQQKSVVSIKLQFQFPTDYPSGSPPVFHVLANWLRGEERRELEEILTDIYLTNIGEIIVYLWVEAVREYLEKMPQNCQQPSDTETEKLCDDAEDVDALVEQMDEVVVYSHASKERDSPLHQPKDDGVECPEILHGGFLMDRKSRFQAHLAAVHHKDQVDIVKNKLLENRKIAEATHNIIAFRIKVKDTDILHQGCEDDGEVHAGSRVLHLLNIIGALNVMVIVTRWYGGVHLGPDRYKHINNCAREILLQAGYLKDKQEKKGPKSKNSKSR